MRFAPLLPMLLAPALASCSIFPLPEDVTGFNSEDIVRITRCQARDGTRDEIQRALLFPTIESRIVYHGMTGAQLAAWLREQPERYRKLNIDELEPQMRRLYRFYADLQISYDFTIDSTEFNTAGFDLSILKTFRSGSNLFEISSRNDRTRQVKLQTRHFDSFDSLTRGMAADYCKGVPAYINPVYPAAGLTKIKVLLRQFIDENQSDNLGNLGPKPKAVDAEANTTIVFTTKTSGNFDPVISTSALNGAYTPTSAKFNSDNYRQDIHTIIVLIQLPDKRDNLVLFDINGHILSIGPSRSSQARADAKFQEIRRNNYQDDFSNIQRDLAGTLLR